ncbi:MAG: hypothetical protein HQL45_02965 [Alphaproteobacteria bacterium]|nr:hypothetical protein [Alphaproteobacteria bacterium]MBF0354280.1 hypothetical protein [Alphaproteobacteria bacterium]
MASTEAIAALGTGTHDFIAAADLWALFLGTVPEFDASGAALWQDVLAWPAWTVILPVGALFVLAFRTRKKRPFGKRRFA